jgi:lipase ATG15
LNQIYHIGSHQYSHLLRKVDVSPKVLDRLETDAGQEVGSAGAVFAVQSSLIKIERLSDRRRHIIDSLLMGRGMPVGSTPDSATSWTLAYVRGPNVTDKQTILSFAQMAASAYFTQPVRDDWINIGFNYTEDFGWEDDGLRGHIFADPQNKTVVISLKGTSLAFLDGSETQGNDRRNDNLFGSCCCGQGGHYAWEKVCDCQTSEYVCNSTCLTQSLQKKSAYYHAALDLYHNITALYPNADIWLTGHSLGGVVSSLLGQTFGLPTVTFEAFPDALAAQRLGLPTPPGHHVGIKSSYTGIFHFGHTADPVYMGICNSFNSPCTVAGFAFQSECHTGYNCTYDTVKDLGWGVSIGTHRITSVIRDVIERYNSTPVCVQHTNCVDCSRWTFLEGNGTQSTTSATRTITSTSTGQSTTTTCQTPGWWGCRDKTTTISTPLTTTTSTSPDL